MINTHPQTPASRHRARRLPKVERIERDAGPVNRPENHRLAAERENGRDSTLLYRRSDHGL